MPDAADALVRGRPPAEGAAARPRRSGPAEAGRHAHQLPVAGQEQGAHRAAGRAQGPRASRWTRCRASRARRRWTRCRRWPTSPATAPSSRPPAIYGRFFTGQIDRGRQGAARARCSSSAPASPASRPSAPPAASAPSCAPSTPARRCKEQVESMGAEFIELDVARRRRGRRRLRQGDEPRLHRGRDGAVRGAGAARSTSSSRRRSFPDKPAPEAHHRGDGEGHEARLGHRRPGGRERRQLRAARVPGQVVEASRRARSSATPTCRAGWRRTASHLYGNNLVHLLERHGRGRRTSRIDENDEVVRGALDPARRRAQVAAAEEGPPAGRRAEAGAPRLAAADAAGARRATVTAQPRPPAAAPGRPSLRSSPRCCSRRSASSRRGEFLSHFTVFVLAVRHRLAGRSGTSRRRCTRR